MQEMPKIAHRRREAVSESRHVDHVRVAAGLVHRPDFPGVKPQRLLAHHVFAGLRGGDGDRLVREVRGRDDDGVNIRIAARLLGIGRNAVDAPIVDALPQ